MPPTMDLGTLMAHLGVDTSDLKKAEQSVDKFGNKVDKEFKEAGRDADKLSNKLGGVSKAMVAIGAAAGSFLLVRSAVGSLNRSMKEFIDLAVTQEDAEKKLESVLRATGNAAGFTLRQMKALAAGYQQLTTVGDEVTLDAMAMLSTFKQVRGEGFERTLMAAMDLSQVMRQDLKSSIVQVGKAVNDPILGLSMLNRVGIQFTKDQKSLIKSLQDSGQLMKAQGVILNELESQFGGAARAARETFGGMRTVVGNTVGDMKEGLGQVVTQNEEVLRSLKDLDKWIRESAPEMRDAFEGAVGPMTTGLLNLGKAAAKITTGALKALTFGQKRARKYDPQFIGNQFLDPDATLLADTRELFSNMNEIVNQELLNQRKFSEENAQGITDDLKKQLEKRVEATVKAAARAAESEFKFNKQLNKEMYLEDLAMAEKSARDQLEFGKWVWENRYPIEEEGFETIENLERDSLDERSRMYDIFLSSIRYTMTSVFEDLFLGIEVSFENTIKKLAARLAAEQFTYAIMGGINSMLSGTASGVGSSLIGSAGIGAGLSGFLGSPVIGATSPVLIGEVTGAVGGTSALGGGASAGLLGGMTWGTLLGGAGLAAGAGYLAYSLLSQDSTKYGEVGGTSGSYTAGKGFGIDPFADAGRGRDSGMSQGLVDALNTGAGEILDNFNTQMAALILTLPEGFEESINDVMVNFGTTYESGFYGFSVSEKGNVGEEINTILTHVEEQLWDAFIPRIETSANTLISNFKGSSLAGLVSPEFMSMANTISGGVSAFGGDTGAYLKGVSDFVSLQSAAESTWDTINTAITDMIDPVSSFSKEVDTITGKFDTWIETLKQLGFSEEALNQIRTEEITVLTNLVTEWELEIDRIADNLEQELQAIETGLETTVASIQSAANRDIGAWTGLVGQATLFASGEGGTVEGLMKQYAGVESSLTNLDTNSENYNREAISLYQQQLTILGQVRNLQEQQVQANEGAISGIDDLIREISFGGLSAVTGGGSYGFELNRLFEQAMTGSAADVDEFLQFAPEYLGYMEAYGEDYNFLTGQMIEQLGGLKNEYETRNISLQNTITNSVGDVVNVQELTNSLLDVIITKADVQIAAINNASTAEIAAANAAANAAIAAANAAAAIQTGNVQAGIDTATGVITPPETVAGNVVDSSPAANPPVSTTPNTPVVDTPAAVAYGVVDIINAIPGVTEIWSTYAIQASIDRFGYDTALSRFKQGMKSQNLDARAEGGLTNGLTLTGEVGPEWVVPTYEPQRSDFLRDVGVDPVSIGRAVAQQIGESGGDVYLDGRKVGEVIADRINMGDSDIITSIRRRVNV